MKYAWIENNRIRDVAHSDPTSIFHPEVAVLYNTLVPDDAANYDEWVDGKLIKQVIPEPRAVEPPARTWGVFDVRSKLSLAEKVTWDAEVSAFIKTAKIELNMGLTLAAATLVLQMLVDSTDISAASMNKILE
jgi:hypothetical protein